MEGNVWINILTSIGSVGLVGFLFWTLLQNKFNALEEQLKSLETDVDAMKGTHVKSADMDKIYSQLHDIKNGLVKYMPRIEHKEWRDNDIKEIAKVEARLEKSIEAVKTEVKDIPSQISKILREAMNK